MSVRFGNVAGSTGSVLRIFSEHIKKGQPIRITDPHATRYFMSIPEAVSLILCAASIGKGGETFIFNMGEPVNIYELARALTLFAGVVPEEDLPIQFTGLKEGEKVSEELWEDSGSSTGHGESARVQATGSNPLAIEILPAVLKMQELLVSHDQTGLLDFLDEIVPTFALQRSGISPLPGGGYRREIRGDELMNIPLSAPDIGEREVDYVNSVMRSNQLSMGPWLERFEKRFASYVGTRHAIAVNSGTSGLHLCCARWASGPTMK